MQNDEFVSAPAKGFEVLRRSRLLTPHAAEPAPSPAQAPDLTWSDADVALATPVYVEPTSGLRLIPTGEVLVRLKPEVDPDRYFGPDAGRVRPLRGTPDQYVLGLTAKTAQEIFADVEGRLRDSRVIWAEPNFLGEVERHTAPNDTLFPRQWHLHNTGQGGGIPGADVRVQEAWNISRGSPHVVVAVIDDGVQIDHPDLRDNIWRNSLEIPNNQVDDDGNGYVDDVNGWDYQGADNDPSPNQDEDNHGTAVAGLIAAVADNALGVAGVAAECRILPIKIASGGEWVSSDAVAEAIHYAAGHASRADRGWQGADILNLSLGLPSAHAIWDALRWAGHEGAQGRGTVLLASSGNGAFQYFPFAVSNVTAGTHVFRFEFARTATTGLGLDTVWIDDVVFPGGDREGFEGSEFPPPGWMMTGAAPWTRETTHHRVRGSGTGAARSGEIAPLQESLLEVTKTTEAGTLVFWASPSCRNDMDGLTVSIDGMPQTLYQAGDSYARVSGVLDWQRGVAFPASHPDVIAVGASTDVDRRADYSQYGEGEVHDSRLSVVAPSSGGFSDIVTTDRTGASGYNASPFEAGDYGTEFGGTSAASPIAAAVAALVRSVAPWHSPQAVKSILERTADKIGPVPYEGGYNAYYGFGRVNAGRAAAWAAQWPAILTQTEEKVTLTGQPASLAISITGAPPWRIQWFRDNVTLPAGTNALLHLGRSAYSDDGLYSVTVANDFGTVTGRTVRLFVGPVVNWGSRSIPPVHVPDSATNVVAVALGGGHGMALRANGTVVVWGSNDTQLTAVPAAVTNVLAISAGDGHCLALRSDGTVLAWGHNDSGQSRVPVGLSNVTAVAAGAYHSLALRVDGTVAAWGSDFAGQANVPRDLAGVVRIAAGYTHSLALRADGTVVAWGSYRYFHNTPLAPIDVPSGLREVVGIAAGSYHNLALRSDGRVVAWGDKNEFGELNVPVSLTNAIAVAAGDRHSLALTEDGTVLAWGANFNGEASVPKGLADVIAVAAAGGPGIGNRSAALVGAGPPTRRPTILEISRTGPVLQLRLATAPGKIYRLEYTDALGHGQWHSLPPLLGTGSSQILADSSAGSSARFYRVRQD